MNIISSMKNIYFLQGGGEMGELIRQKDWSETSVGNPETWSQSLRTTLSIILNAKLPMFLFWGPELICFYNDAFRPCLGNDGKHPTILGNRGEGFWKEIRTDIEPLIEHILSGAEATWNEEQRLLIYKNGKIKEAYWTFSYSPVYDESGKPGGVFVTCFENTKKVLALKNLKESEEQLEFTINAAELGTWNFNPKTSIFSYNQQLRHWFGFQPEFAVDVLSVFDSIIETDRQKTIDAMATAMATGSTGIYEIQHTVISKFDGKERIILAKGKALFDKDGEVYRFSGTGQDVTDEVLYKKNQEEKINFNTMLLEVNPDCVKIIDGNGRISYVNNNGVCILEGDSKDYFINREWETLWGEDEKKIVRGAIEKAFQGETINFQAPALTVKGTLKWWDVIISALPDDDGKVKKLLAVSRDISGLKRADKLLRETEYRFRDMIHTSPFLISILKGDKFIIDVANDAIIEVWGKGKDVIGKSILEVLPEIIEQGFEDLLNQVYQTGIPFKADDMPVHLMKNGVSVLNFFNFVYQAQRDTDGKIESITILATDVTKQVELNQKLQENERILRQTKEQLELTFANVPAAIFLYNDNKELLFANEKAAKLFHYKTVDKLLLDKNFNTIMDKVEEIFHVCDENNQPFTRDKLPTASTLNSGTPSEVVSSIQKKSGGLKTWYINKSSPILDEHGNTSMILTTSTDITIQKLAEETIRDSESRFRLLADNAPMWVWIIDLEVNVSYANLELLNYVGLNHSSEFKGKIWKQIVHPDDVAVMMECFQKSIAERVTFHYEARVKNIKSGIYEWFYVKAIPRYENEEFIGFIGTGLNIQQQKTFSQTLESEVQERTAELKIVNDMLFLRNDMLSVSESFNRNLTELSPNVVYILDLEENKITFLNQTGLKLIGTTWKKVETLEDKIQPLIVHPDDTISVAETIEKVKNSFDEQVFEHEYRIKNAEGNWTPILARDTAFKRDEHKKVTQLLGIAIDITEIKKAKTVLEEKNQELIKMNKELESFAYVSSHDLQEPLRKIQAFSSRLMEKENENLSDSGKDYLRRMRLAGERMQQLIQDLLAYSRTKTTDRKFEKINLETIINEVAEDLKDELILKNGSIIIGDVFDLNIITFQFRQLLYNLMSNSLKFARKGIDSIIKVNCKIAKGQTFDNEKLSPETAYCHISITDNGIGFDANYKDKIFEIFQRLHGREEYIGTGIGLAIVKKIVENHDGFIDADGEVGKGATFNIYIPV